LATGLSGEKEEPAGWAFLTLGLGAIGAVLRRESQRPIIRFEYAFGLSTTVGKAAREKEPDDPPQSVVAASFPT
jgi:MYXO-CTERM domain-containing protein